jgi:3-phenylpropionate/trans-cinnamate dioxygenase ferredoxin subunit
MAKHVVGRVAQIPEGGRLIVTLQGHSIGVFNVGGRLFALLNRCPHQGAELCRGSVLSWLEAEAPGQYRRDGSRHLLQCPWHGWEFDLETGRSFSRSRVRPYPVSVEPGGRVAQEVASGDAALASPSSSPPPVVAEGRSASRLHAGPFIADKYPVAVEDGYIVVTLPGRLTNRRDTNSPQTSPAHDEGSRRQS